MSGFGIGDLAQNLFTQQRSGSLQRDLARLTDELSSGRKQDLTASVRGNFGQLGVLTQRLTAADALSEVRADLELTYSATRLAYDGLLSTTQSLGADLLAAIGLQQSLVEDERIHAARHEFSATLATLNTRIGDRYVFSGVASDTPPMADAELILDDLRTAVAGATDAAGFNQIVDDWFLSPAGGFETVAYQGGVTASTDVVVGLGKKVSQLETAADTAFRETLKDLAKITLLSEGAFSGQVATRRDILRSAGEGLLSANQQLITNAARLGSREAQLEAVEVQSRTQQTNIETARASILEIDPYAVATELQAVQQQIETLYLMTARNQRLRLTEFLR